MIDKIKMGIAFGLLGIAAAYWHLLLFTAVVILWPFQLFWPLPGKPCMERKG